ncbi:MAG: hypothetical protein IPN69_16580 [Acidobacteria bacterium]|nr:hypothetical protein [Acidobacteriota bacterium]MBK8147117.1 hypothetical protein [Acidobacteriota bacterium]MBK8812326.1 hypothetical protein [Acidobacteriota bacterium]
MGKTLIASAVFESIAFENVPDTAQTKVKRMNAPSKAILTFFVEVIRWPPWRILCCASIVEILTKLFKKIVVLFAAEDILDEPIRTVGECYHV